MTGWSINLSLPGEAHTFELDDWPVPPLFTTPSGLVCELVFWSDYVERWIHAVSRSFERVLPADHVQVAVGDLAWINVLCRRLGRVEGLKDAVQQLVEEMTPEG